MSTRVIRKLSVTWRRPSLFDCYVSSPLLVAVMLLHGGFFFRTGSPFEQHPLALSGLREVYLALCLFAGIFVLAEGLRRRTLFFGDFMVLFVVTAFVFGSALLANLKFGQPLLYGLFEERRTFMVFGGFLLLAAMHATNAKPMALIGALYWSTLIYVLIGLLLQTGILGDLAARDIPAFDPRKYRILVGIDLYQLSTIIAAVMVFRFNAWQHLIPLCVGAAGLVLLAQTRSIMMSCGAAVLVAFALSRPWRFWATTLGGLLLVLALLLMPAGSGDLQGEIQSVPEVVVRVHTAEKILDALQANDWIGMGSLSLQWQDGFRRVYDRFFFLSDVGLLGEFYRFGLFLPLIYLAFGLAVYAYLRENLDPIGRGLCEGLLWLACFDLLLGGLIAFTGARAALFIAVASAFRQNPYLARPGSTAIRFAGVHF